MDERWNVYLKDIRFRPSGTKKEFDGRDPFENDYSRLITSSPVRRLQDKTQVFPLEKSDFPRTRLTHSLEVSSIARSIGKSIEKQILPSRLAPEFQGQLASLLATAGLIHDLGNPPFGHFGEKAIQSFFTDYINKSTLNLNDQEKNDFKYFDGNVQTLRILRKLYFLIDENGYNLSYPSLHVIVKYPCSSIDGNKGDRAEHIKFKKFGYFCSEQNDFETITKELQLNSTRHPLTYLLEAADDIAYSSTDVEDAVKMGTLDCRTIIEVLEDEPGRYTPEEKKIIEDFRSSFKKLSRTVVDANDIAVQQFRIAVQTLFIEAIIREFFDNYASLMDGTYPHELLEKCTCQEMKHRLDKLFKIILRDKKVIGIELAGWNVLVGLLSEYIPACQAETSRAGSKTREGRLYQTISSSFRHLYETRNQYHNETYNRLQLVVDYISGMTDNFALELFQRLKGIRTT